jgi:hypothetical protein
VAGGHSDPTYYLLCSQSGTTVLYKRSKAGPAWLPISLPAGVQIIPYDPNIVQHGPLFLNPYEAGEFYLSCTDGVYHGLAQLAVGSTQGAAHTVTILQKDVALTNFISGNGSYPINTTFSGGNDSNVVWANQSSGNAMYPLSWLSFNRFNNQQAVASSPFTGVFFKDGSSPWKDYSYLLPKPFTPVSSVNINEQGIYITTEGRGMLKLTGY